MLGLVCFVVVCVFSCLCYVVWFGLVLCGLLCACMFVVCGSRAVVLRRVVSCVVFVCGCDCLSWCAFAFCFELCCVSGCCVMVDVMVLCVAWLV